MIEFDQVNKMKYLQFEGENVSIDVQMNIAKRYTVPMDEENKDYQEILEWVAEGNTIEEAD